MGLLVSGVTVISAHEPKTGLPRGMTANAVMSVSLTPALVVVSVRRNARLHRVLQTAGAYGVTVLGASQVGLAKHFAGLSAATGEAGPEFAYRDGVPVLRRGLAWLVARITAAYEAGDHTLFLGEVTSLSAEAELEPPLAFHRSAFARLESASTAGPGHAWETGLDVWG